MQDESGRTGHGLATAAAALIAAMLIAPIVHRINVGLSCHLGTAAPIAGGRLHAPPAPRCDEGGDWAARTTRRAGP
ncbi:MAG TPA: hypothetical protein VGC15_17595 [Acetobacteraceae bacterium]